ncbi:hypothetical protein V6N13_108722 [Hibiscus sabdariffa]
MDKVTQIERDELHLHPLVLAEAQGQDNENEKADYSMCREVMSTSKFTYLHCHCSQITLHISTHPFHPQQGGLDLQPQPERFAESACAMCKEEMQLVFFLLFLVFKVLAPHQMCSLFFVFD